MKTGAALENIYQIQFRGRWRCCFAGYPVKSRRKSAGSPDTRAGFVRHRRVVKIRLVVVKTLQHRLMINASRVFARAVFRQRHICGATGRFAPAGTGDWLLMPGSHCPDHPNRLGRRCRRSDNSVPLTRFWTQVFPISADEEPCAGELILLPASLEFRCLLAGTELSARTPGIVPGRPLPRTLRSKRCELDVRAISGPTL